MLFYRLSIMPNTTFVFLIIALICYGGIFVHGQTYTLVSAGFLTASGSPAYGGVTGPTYLAQGEWINGKTILGYTSYMVLQWNGQLCIYTGTSPGSSDSAQYWCATSTATGYGCSNNTSGYPQTFAVAQTDYNFCQYCGSSPSSQGNYMWCNGIAGEQLTVSGYMVLPAGNTSAYWGEAQCGYLQYCYYASLTPNWQPCGRCASGYSLCSWAPGGCKNLQTDVNNCGSCGFVCPTTWYVYYDGSYGNPSPSICCGGTCYAQQGYGYNAADESQYSCYDSCTKAYCGSCGYSCDLPPWECQAPYGDNGWICLNTG